MQTISNAKGLSPQLLDRARSKAWQEVRGRAARCKDPDYLGSGHFSVVYLLDYRHVVKIGGPGGYGRGRTSGDTTFRDDYGTPLPDAWPQYVEWTASMRRRPTWAPKVYHLEFMRPRIYFAVCERLCSDGDQRGMSVPVRITRSRALRLGLQADLHDDNFMLRPRTGAIVINDPFCPP